MTKILVVDDSTVDCLLLKTFAERIPGSTVIQADNGKQALEQLEQWGADLIVTDLMMPKMDGLEFLTTVRTQYPNIPVILATGKGSEDIAAEALGLGAVGYVPKTQLEKLLVPTIRSALSNLNLERGFVGIMESAEVVKLRLLLKNDSAQFPRLINYCKMMLEEMSSLDVIGRIRVGVAIEQALHNAMYRGNLEMGPEFAIPFGDESPLAEMSDRVAARLDDPHFRDRKIKVDISIDRSSFWCRVKDDGAGFNPDLRSRSLTDDHGRGLMLIMSFMDSVKVNETGNAISFRLNWEPKITAQRITDLDESTSHAVPDRKNLSSTGEKIGQLISKQTGRKIDIDRREFVIGRSTSCHMLVTNANVSNHHCMLVLQKGDWFVKDLHSENGVTVNGEKVSRARIASGDVLGIANLRYEVQFVS